MSSPINQPLEEILYQWRLVLFQRDDNSTTIPSETVIRVFMEPKSMRHESHNSYQSTPIPRNEKLSPSLLALSSSSLCLSSAHLCLSSSLICLFSSEDVTEDDSAAEVLYPLCRQRKQTTTALGCSRSVPRRSDDRILEASCALNLKRE